MLKRLRVIWIIIVCVLILMFTGCGRYERAVAAATGYSEICVDGVVYLQFTSGATAKLNRDGSVVNCK